MQDNFVCKIPLLARRTLPSATIGYLVYKRYICSRARPSARATIGYLVYNYCLVYGLALIAKRIINFVALMTQHSLTLIFQLYPDSVPGRRYIPPISHNDR